MYTVSLGELKFEWDEGKSRANRSKHRITFNEAATAFLDEFARIIPDPEHADDEQRLLLLGTSGLLNVLVVCHCYRVETDVIRIIFARRADKSERNEYAEYLP